MILIILDISDVLSDLCGSVDSGSGIFNHNVTCAGECGMLSIMGSCSKKAGNQVLPVEDVGKTGTLPIPSIDQQPEWIQIYFIKSSDREYKCNICEAVVLADQEDEQLSRLEHITSCHKEIYDLHKETPDGSIGFQIEFLQFNMLKDDDTKSETVMLSDAADATSVAVRSISSKDNKPSDMHYVLIPKKKKLKKAFDFSRKRSWVWKYFDKLSNVIYRCTLCHVVLSIKGCNTNNMNRHVRTKHPGVFKSEVEKKDKVTDISLEDTGYVIKRENDITPPKDVDEPSAESVKQRRSWIWLYFTRVTNTLAQCKLCKRTICHGGNATGNMNRHLKMVHYKTGDTSWVWKVFESNEPDFFSCKICQYKCMKFEDVEKNIKCILEHLKTEHEVVSGDQIIADAEYDIEES